MFLISALRKVLIREHEIFEFMSHMTKIYIILCHTIQNIKREDLIAVLAYWSFGEKD